MRYQVSTLVMGMWLACGGILLYGQGAPFQARNYVSSETPLASEAITGVPTLCINGLANTHPCDKITMMAFLPSGSIGGTGYLEDLWGWTANSREFALVGRFDGTAFIEVTDPTNPVYLGKLPTHTGNSDWRDIKVYADHAFIVSEAAGHGMQVFDLTQLLSVTTPPVTFAETTHYNNIARAHNIFINEQTGYAYVAGAREGGQTCGKGLHMINIQNPTSPTFAGCFIDYTIGRGYTHDAQCVVYQGPDAAYVGREICLNSNEASIVIADVTDKANPTTVATITYPTVQYIHQGWLTEDHRYFFQNDELDEIASASPLTHTMVWDLAELDNPILASTYIASTTAIDHNLYIDGDRMYQANYTAGLRIIDISNPLTPVETAFFDTYTPNDGTTFNGAWSIYPFFPSGNLIVSDIDMGFFVLQPESSLLPVELVSFEVVLDGHDALLSWQTASETNNAGFEIQMHEGTGTDSNAWKVLGFVDGYGTTLELQSYRYRVEGLLPGRHRFRLKQIDYDGTFEFSPEVEALMELPDATVQADVYPNPFREHSTLRLALLRDEHVRVEVVDLLGRRVALFHDGPMPAQKTRRFVLDAATLSNGLYMWRVTGNTFSETRLVTLVK